MTLPIHIHAPSCGRPISVVTLVSVLVLLSIAASQHRQAALRLEWRADRKLSTATGAKSVELVDEEVQCFEGPDFGRNGLQYRSSENRRTEDKSYLRRASEALTAKSSSLTLMTSTGLGTWASDGISLAPSEGMLRSFRELVLQLPDEAWESDGSKRKDDAHKRDISKLKQQSFREPALYDGLKVVILEDACFLKASFWDAKNKNFNISSGISLNYLQAGFKTPSSLVQPYLDRGFGFDDGWCVNFASDKPGYLENLGFRAEFVEHLSLFDELATDSMKRTVFGLITAGNSESLSILSHSKILHESGKLDAVVDKLRSADIIIANGGNPDFSKYVFLDFAGELLKPVIDKVQAGSVIYMGQSAGSMVGSADMGLTIEPRPAIFKLLDKEDTRGLSLVGCCAIRPHTPLDSKLYDIVAAVYGKLKGVKVIRIHNGDGLQCIKGFCKVVGNTGLPKSVFDGPYDPHLERLVEAFKPALPQRREK
eukprot:TRINITY_DN18270_c0_g5_i1.p1 TRINITY_DN18270_c0_g5~~TRINITY_DN18270_c0_g5_i1.p1  ORF type:complete len:482 (+),score=51.78 TRINITY_DN18270_c0_g5_i1:61-1506(+)